MSVYLVTMILIYALQVMLHLERFSARHNLLHVGVSFHSPVRSVRYDFRSFHDDQSYETSDRLFVGYDDPTPGRYAVKTVAWGTTDKSFDEIAHFERRFLRSRRYILGVYDCRHFVRDMTEFATGTPTPVWRLNRLWMEKNI